MVEQWLSLARTVCSGLALLRIGARNIKKLRGSGWISQRDHPIAAAAKSAKLDPA
jgi:hypothetical protein